MNIQKYLFRTEFKIKDLLPVPLILVGLVVLGGIGSIIENHVGIAVLLFMSYSIVTLSFVLTRNILVPFGLFVSYNTIVIVLRGSFPDLTMMLVSAFLQSLFIALIFILVNKYDKKPSDKISKLDFISVIITSVILTILTFIIVT